MKPINGSLQDKTAMDDKLAGLKSMIEDRLQNIIDYAQAPGSAVCEAMDYSLQAGGKRLRPLLCLVTAEMFGCNPAAVLDVACALEMVHTYSLVHDDLPAMDDDDYRRNKPTCHRVYGEAIAVLAGDALLTLAFELLSGHGLKNGNHKTAFNTTNTNTNTDTDTDINTNTTNITSTKDSFHDITNSKESVHGITSSEDAEKALQMINELARAAGFAGMIGGQELDLAAEGKETDIEGMERISAHKTGALLQASVKLGAIAAGAGAGQLDALDRFAASAGLAFQIADDLLNYCGDAEQMGKNTGTDRERSKATYPLRLGEEAARNRLDELHDSALRELEQFGDSANTLRYLTRYLVYRES